MPAGKHTPGEWSVGSVVGEGPADLHILSDAGTILATVTEKGGPPTLSIDEARANARLMATAPELLAELARVKNGLYNLCEMGLVRPKEETLQAARRIAALIAKAEGK